MYVYINVQVAVVVDIYVDLKCILGLFSFMESEGCCEGRFALKGSGGKILVM